MSGPLYEDPSLGTECTISKSVFIAQGGLRIRGHIFVSDLFGFFFSLKLRTLSIFMEKLKANKGINKIFKKHKETLSTCILFFIYRIIWRICFL